MKSIKYLVLTLFLIWLNFNLVSGDPLYKSVEGGGYGVVASSFVEGIDSIGCNPANLDFEEKEIGLFYNNWFANLFLANVSFSLPHVASIFNWDTVNAINVGILSTGSFEKRNSDGDLIGEDSYEQYIVSVLKAVKVQDINLGIGLNYITPDKESISKNDFTINMGVKYTKTLTTIYDIISGISVNNILSDENNYILPLNINTSVGLISYRATQIIGVGVGYSFFRYANYIGIGGFYSDKAKLSDNMEFYFKFYASYQFSIDNNSKSLENESFKGLKCGIEMKFKYFSLMYSYENFGFIGGAYNLGLKIPLK